MPPDARQQFSVAEARRIALAAQGFAGPRPSAVINAGHVRRVVRRLGLLQLDFVNVLVPAHQLVAFSRLGPYDFATFERAVYRDAHCTEQWAHEASIVPMECWPLLRHRRAQYRQHPRTPLFRLPDHRRYLRDVLEQVREEGPVTAGDLPPAKADRTGRKPGDWHRSVPRWALEYHFGRGDLAVAQRLGNFQRVYDLPERLVPPEVIEHRPDRFEAECELVARAAAAHGIGTTADIADYYRMTTRDTARCLDELAAAGSVRRVNVEGWSEGAWLHREATLPRALSTSALLSPFDPVVWFRPRAERLFGFHYRIEIYVPEAKRRWGYYVLPFLCDDRLAARVDLKAERKERVLRVRAAHAEDGIDRDDVAARLAGELRVLADWLQLDEVRVGRKGDFAVPLGRAVRATQ